MSGIWFKDEDGEEWCLTVYSEKHGEEKADPEDMARAYHAMEDGEALEMARVYARLPKQTDRELTRSFDDSLAREVERLTAEAAAATPPRNTEAEATFVDVMAKAIRNGSSEEALRFLAQLLGYPPCSKCDFVAARCKCLRDS